MNPEPRPLLPSTQALLERVEANSPAERQIKSVEKLSNITQLVVDGIGQLNSETLKDTQLVVDTLNGLVQAVTALDKEPPEQEDFATPIVKAVEKLQAELNKSIKSIEVKPQFNPSISVESPDVNVPAVDLKGVERVLRQDIPKAFKDAIAGIPKVDIPKTDLEPLEERMSEMIQWLESIDTASRIKPQAPSVLKVTNLDGTAVGTRSITERYDYGTPPVYYVGEATVGTADAGLGWKINKFDLTSSSNAKGLLATDVSWSNRAAGTYL
jgi:hypothetical protein